MGRTGTVLSVWRAALRDSLVQYAPALLKRLLVVRYGRQAHDRELAMLPGLVDRHRQVVDVGAHRGLYALSFERMVGAARLHLFEPVPELYDYLRRLFAQARVYAVALSDRPGEGTLRVPLVGGKRLASRATLQSDVTEVGTAGQSQYRVVTRRLDDYLTDGTLQDVGFLKIDVEGHELHVLRGAERLLGTCRPVLLIEIEQRHHDFPIARVHEWLVGAGYDLYFVHPEDSELVPLREFSAERDQDPTAAGTTRYVNNFFGLPRERAESLLAHASERQRDG